MLRNLLLVAMAFASIETFAETKTICGPTDNRVVSEDSPVGRLSAMDRNYGCTVTLIGKSCAITAGHCKGTMFKAQFNTPGPNDDGLKPSESEDIYTVDQESIRFQDLGKGKDWGVFRLNKNEITDKWPGDVQGFYQVDFKRPRIGTQLRISGYGYAQNPKYSFVQQTHSGRLSRISVTKDKSLMSYPIDTMGGNSGSTIRVDSNDKIVGIHTHGGCSAKGGTNNGTLISGHPELIKAIRSCLESEKNL